MKETKIEKLILDLSNRWEVSPEEAVDRLNSMNESEINKLINSMTKKFQMGGRAFRPNIPYGNYRIFNKETVVLPKKPEVTQAQIDSVYNAEQEAFQKRASKSIPELEQKLVDLRDVMGWNKSQRVKPIPGIKIPVTNSDEYYNNLRSKFTKGGLMDCLRNGGSISKCKCGCNKIVKDQEPAGPLGAQVDGMGLKVQLPNRNRDLKYSNIISNGVTGKAATWIPKDGKSQITEFLMADNNPDVPGYANDIRMKIARDPRTGELGDTLLQNKILPGVYLPGLPIKYRADRSVVRNAKKRK